MPRIFGFLLAVLIVLAAAPASAMDFKLLQESSGPRVVLASGEIGPGDAQMLATALNLATRDRHGTKELLLNSPGGSVFDALAMTDVMDHVGVSTIIPDHALCGSACASVLFVSGKYRTIETGGLLAIHSCYDIQSGTKVSLCNELISAHAQEEGVPGGAMMAFQEAAGPNAALVFNAKGAACFGLTRQPGTARATALAPCLQAAINSRPRR